MVGANSTVVVEHRRDRSLPERVGDLSRVRSETYGTTSLTFFRLVTSRSRASESATSVD